MAGDEDGEIWMWRCVKPQVPPAVLADSRGQGRGQGTLRLVWVLSLCDMATWLHCLGRTLLISNIRSQALTV